MTLNIAQYCSSHNRGNPIELWLQGADATANNDQEHTPLYAAVAAKQNAAVQALCQAGALAVNTADEWGLSPLHIAARAGDADTVTLLLLAQVRSCNRLLQCISCLQASAGHCYIAANQGRLCHYMGCCSMWLLSCLLWCVCVHLSASRRALQTC